MRQAWWWLGLPLATAAAILITYRLAPQFYIERLLPEGYGLLEISHFLFPLIGFFYCLALLRTPVVKAWPLLKGAVIVFAIACFYIAGEEMSWGQWFFYWNTPEFWSGINRQQETNLHNTSYFFNQLPQTLLEIAIVIGGLVLPVFTGLRQRLNLPILDVLTPSLAIVPVALVSVAFKTLDRLEHQPFFADILIKPSEATETFFHMFIMFYTIMLHQRLAGAAKLTG